MAIKLRTRFGALDPLDAVLEGDVLFFKDDDEDGDGDGAGGSAGGSGSSQEDDDDADDDDGASGSGDGESDDDEDDDDDEKDARVRRANKQAAKLRVRLKEQEKELAKLRAAAKPDKDKSDDAGTSQAKQEAEEARRRADAAEAKLRKIERESMIVRTVGTVKLPDGKRFADADTIVALVESGRVPDVEIEDDGTIDRADLKAALKQLAKDKPHLLADSSTEGDGKNRGEGTNPRRRDRTSEAIDKLPAAQRPHARLVSAFSRK